MAQSDSRDENSSTTSSLPSENSPLLSDLMSHIQTMKAREQISQETTSRAQDTEDVSESSDLLTQLQDGMYGPHDASELLRW